MLSSTPGEHVENQKRSDISTMTQNQKIYKKRVKWLVGKEGLVAG